MFFGKHGSGPSVILVHGLAAYSFSWRFMVKALSERYTTYAVDLLGFGQSPAPKDFPFTMSAQADAVMEFVKREGISQPVIIGHSMGGGVCLRLAEQMERDSRSKPSKMVLIAPVAYPPQATPTLFGAAALSALGTFLLINPPLPAVRALVQNILQKAYHDDSKITSEQIDGYVKGLSEPDQFKAFVRHAETIGQVSVPESRLSGIETNTCIIWGKEDRFVSSNDMAKLSKALPNSSFKEVQNCGHIPQEEFPDVTNKLVTDFLNDAS